MRGQAAAATPSDPVRLRARRPDDLLAVVPYLLGFNPTESLVTLLVRDGRVALTARLDLQPGTEAALTAYVQDLAHAHGAATVVLVAYSANREEAAAVLRHLLDEVVEVPVDDALLVAGERWWSLACTSGCCPEEGRPYDPGAHPFAAEAVFAGLSARPSRTDVAAQVVGPDSGDWAALRELARQLRDPLRALGSDGRRQRMAAAVVAGLDPVDPPEETARRTSELGDESCLELALLARESRVRDVACALVTRERAESHVALWQRVVARVPSELAVAPLCLLGLAAWVAGNGTLLNCAEERVEALDPEYPMGRLLADVAGRGLPPSWWDAMGADLRSDLGLAGDRRRSTRLSP